MNDRVEWRIAHLPDPKNRAETGNMIRLDRFVFGDAFFVVHRNGDVEVLDPTTVAVEPAAPPATAPKPEEKESAEQIARRARKPPADGPCKRCGDNKPINRLMLCYPCWVKTELEKNGWREGQPHPPGCGCDVDCRFEAAGANS